MGFPHRFFLALLCLLCGVLPVRAAPATPLERGTAILDPLALRELDRGRFGLGRILQPASSADMPLDNAQLYPWTTLFYAPQVVEGRIAARYILDTKPDAKLAILFQNDEFGKGYLNAFKAELGSKAQSMIVKEESYDLSSPTIDSQIVSLKNSGADVFFKAVRGELAQYASWNEHV